MISLVRVCAPRTFAWRIFRRLMSSQLSYDVSVRAADLAPPPDLRTPTRGNWGIRTAVFTRHLSTGGAAQAGPFPPPGPGPCPAPYLCGASWPGRFQRREAGLVGAAAPEASWGRDQGYAGQGLHAGHHSGQLRWCAQRVPMGGSGAEGGRGSAKGYPSLKDREGRTSRSEDQGTNEPRSLHCSIQDDLWGDQSLEGEPGLPPGWRKIRDAAGTYYWHVPSGSTQWQRPTWESGDAEDAGTKTEGIWGLRPPKGRSFSSLESSLDRSNSLSWYGEESYIQRMEPGAKCFAVRSLGWVEVPEEDLVPGKSSIAVNNCIQQLAQTCSQSQPPDGAWGEGQNMLMILKKDVMSLVNPLDHSLIHHQPLVHIRVWGVGSSKGRDFAFVAGDKDSCMLKCHVFRCDVPAKAISSALHGLCAQILSERVGVSGDSPCCSLDPISPEDLPRQVELLDAVSQAAQKYEALYMGTLPVTKAMGMDVLNEAIGTLTTHGDRDTWVPAMLSVSDSLMTAHPIQAKAGAEEEPLWQCPVRLVTFIGVGRDPHSFGLIADLGRQSFQCAAFWCQPHAGGLSEAVQAACMVQYQKCLVASAARGKAWGAQARARLRLKQTSSVDSPGGPLPLPLLKGGVGGAGAAPRKRGVFSFLDAFRLKPSLLHMP
ncbi:amyloid-beta A4 precursor protein-binding family B member 3 isoform X1 [Balaenoptera acutorostrata]|uniref:Amyloid-beta A4 precursor protein-binding family B member 3 isoform X1 n=1 Tax=Balaenoptera acutorostrata TaxID=9767 RepID=A0A384B3D8_BALAC|nr:amyloid-beta A4 precursor protein-binding family B member 3 isoform X1 [Balaenoptera acutorostrata]